MSDRNASEPARRPTDEELRRRRASLEEEMYWARHDRVPEAERKANMKRLEREWNDVRREQSARKGESWTYKHDRRDEWTFRTESRLNKRGERVDSVIAEGKIHPRETTINWRTDTGYGRRREDSIRKSISHRTGDDAGHLAKAGWGADPEGVNAGRVGLRRGRRGRLETYDPETGGPPRRLNYTRQNRKMNQGAGYKDVEDGLDRKVSRTREPIDVSITSRTMPKHFRGERDAYRIITARDSNKGPVVVHAKGPGGEEKRVSLDRYYAGNFSSPTMRAAEARKTDGFFASDRKGPHPTPPTSSTKPPRAR